jgi:hypothetical protein
MAKKEKMYMLASDWGYWPEDNATEYHGLFSDKATARAVKRHLRKKMRRDGIDDDDVSFRITEFTVDEIANMWQTD